MTGDAIRLTADGAQGRALAEYGRLNDELAQLCVRFGVYLDDDTLAGLTRAVSRTFFQWRTSRHPAED